MIWNILSALAIGALTGVLVGMPYGQWFGFSTPLSGVLQSLVATIAFTSLTSSRRTELDLRIRELPQIATASEAEQLVTQGKV